MTPDDLIPGNLYKARKNHAYGVFHKGDYLFFIEKSRTESNPRTISLKIFRFLTPSGNILELTHGLCAFYLGFNLD